MIPIVMITLTISIFMIGMAIGLHEQGNYDSQDESITFKGIIKILFGNW